MRIAKSTPSSTLSFDPRPLEAACLDTRLADEAVASLWVSLRRLAENRMLELRAALTELAGEVLEPLDRDTVLKKGAPW